MCQKESSWKNKIIEHATVNYHSNVIHVKAARHAFIVFFALHLFFVWYMTCNSVGDDEICRYSFKINILQDILLFRQDVVAPEFEQMDAVDSKKAIQGYCLMLSVPVFILK